MECSLSHRSTSPTRMLSTHGWKGRGGSICMSSFNVCGATLATALTEEAVQHSSFIALQELTVSAEAEGGLYVHDENWFLLHGTPHWHTHRVTGLLIHSSMYTSISDTVTTPHAASVLCTVSGRSFRVISTHLPHQDKVDEEFYGAFNELSMHLLPASHTVLMGDLNVQLGDSDDVVGSAVQNLPDVRGVELSAFLSNKKLHAVNTFLERAWPTHRSWSGKQESQRDYICTDADWLRCTVSVSEKVHTDHSIVFAELTAVRPPQHYQRSLWGFRPVSTFRYMCNQQLALLSQPPKDLNQLHDTLQAVAWSEVRAAHAQRLDVSPDRPYCHQFATYGLYARWAAAWRRTRRRAAYRAQLELAIAQGGNQWPQRHHRRKVQEWPMEVTCDRVLEHYAHHFALSARQRSEEVLLVCDADSEKEEQPPHDISKEELQHALATLKRRKAPGPDGLPAEALLSASAATLEYLEKFFSDILLGKSGPPRSWMHEQIKLVPKDSFWRGDLKRLRPLLAPAVTHKAYSRILLSRLQQHLVIEAPQYARPGMSPQSIIHHFSLAAQKTYDRHIPLLVLRIDLSSAYDGVLHQRLLACLTAAGTPDYLVQAIRTLITGRRVSFKCGPCQTSELLLERGLAQGHTLSPFLFAFYTAFHTKTLLADWRLCDAELWAIHALLLYMDDGLICASTLEELQRRAELFLQCCEGMGLTLNAAKCSLHCNLHAGDPTTSRIHLQLNGTTLPVSAAQFTFLGHRFNLNAGSSETSLTHRL
eukprot:6459142-Amphidinium_carterae.1